MCSHIRKQVRKFTEIQRVVLDQEEAEPVVLRGDVDGVVAASPGSLSHPHCVAKVPGKALQHRVETEKKKRI